MGRRQSMPSNSMDNWAGVSDTVPLSACGQMKRPRSSRFANRHNPSPSHHNSLIRSPRRPRKAKTCPENGFSFKTVCATALNPVKPRRRSVTPAAIQICVPVGNAIIGLALPTPPGRSPDRPRLRCERGRVLDQCRQCPFGALSRVVVLLPDELSAMPRKFLQEGVCCASWRSPQFPVVLRDTAGAT